MKILVVGDWLTKVYEEAFYDEFLKEHEVDKFSWIQYFKYYQYADKFEVKKNPWLSFYYKLQNKFLIGPVVNKINKDLIEVARKGEYDLIFIYRGTHIFSSTISMLKNTGTIVFGYNNDDPFSESYSPYVWRHFIRSIHHYDYIFSYRLKNIKDYLSRDYNKTQLLRSYYLQEDNYKIHGVSKKIDVIFIGHFENDGRDEIILYLLQNGIQVKVFGTGWEKSIYFKELLVFLGVIKPVYEDYNLYLNSSRIALVFLSKLNNDTYTRRVFEIPATGTVMVSEYTDDLSTLFEEGHEIKFFSDKYSCLKVINELLSSDEYLDSLGGKSFQRLLKDGHEISNRVNQVLDVYYNIKSD